MKVKKLNSNATLPVYKTKSAAGADIKPCIDGEIRPHSTRKVPTGLALELPKEYHLEVKARSSLLLKNVTINGIIDPDYRNEIFLIIANLNDYPVSFSKDSEGLGQIIIKGHEQANFEEVAELTPTDRKGGFGSTNAKVEAVSIHPGKLFFNGTLNKNAKTTFLLDSGADGIFCGQNIAREAKLKLTPLKKAITITMADGKDYFIKNMAKEVPYHIQGFSDTLDLYVMPVDHDHILLGNHWLDRINPAIDWREKTVTIKKNSKTHTLSMKEKSSPDSLNQIKIDYLMMDEQPPKIEKEDQVLMISLEDIDDELGITPESQPEIADPELRMLLDEYKDVFRDKLPDQLPTKRDVEHIIELKEDAQPRRSHQYHLPPAHQEAIQETVAELIKLKHIEPSRSAWRAPLLVVIKKDGTPRVVVDFRFLNSNTVGQDYFMKNPQEMLDAAAGHKFLSSMDFTSGFHQVPMAPKSKELTSFSVPGPKGGQYQFRVMPFGLKGAPATFQ